MAVLHSEQTQEEWAPGPTLSYTLSSSALPHQESSPSSLLPSFMSLMLVELGLVLAARDFLSFVKKGLGTTPAPPRPAPGLLFQGELPGCLPGTHS